MHLGIVLSHLSEHVNYLSHNVLVFRRRPVSDTHHSLVAVLSSLEFFLRDEYVVRKHVRVAYEEGKVAFHLESSHELVVGTFHYLCHHCFFDVLLPSCHHRHLDTVAVEGK